LGVGYQVWCPRHLRGLRLNLRARGGSLAGEQTGHSVQKGSTSESRSVREDHQPRIEDDLQIEVKSCPLTLSGRKGTYRKEDMAASDDTRANGVSLVLYTRKVENDIR